MDICSGGGGGDGGVRLDSHHLRDFLRIGEEDRRNNVSQSASSSAGGNRSSRTGLTLLAVLMDRREPAPPADVPRRSVQSTRTLMDIIREDQIGGRRDSGRSWRQLRDRIRLRHRGGGGGGSAVPFDRNNHRMVIMTRRSARLNSTPGHPLESSQSGVPTVPTVGVPSLRGDSSVQTDGIFEQASQLLRRRSLIEVIEERSGDAVEPPPPVEQPARTSLMALLAENDWPLGYEDSSYVIHDDNEEVDEAEAEAVAATDGGYNNCCVCMVRHKGAAFIPCGHTFCRLCSRELWVQRGNCPLCNNYILEILDIF